MGVIVYNELLVVPYWGFNKNTLAAKAALDNVEEVRKTIEIDNDSKRSSTNKNA